MRDLIKASLLGSTALLFAASASAETAISPTPLVLNDGRTAQVSVHHMPFVPGKSALTGEAASQMEALSSTIATDCFLSAQVIGHARGDEVDTSDTLAMHRLASARADNVQTDLVGGGLPTNGVASTWDWQFLIQEPRVTLWVFELTRGVDCSGEAIDLNVAEQDAAPEGNGEETQSEIITVDSEELPATGSSAVAAAEDSADAAADQTTRTVADTASETAEMTQETISAALDQTAESAQSAQAGAENAVHETAESVETAASATAEAAGNAADNASDAVSNAAGQTASMSGETGSESLTGTNSGQAVSDTLTSATTARAVQGLNDDEAGDAVQAADTASEVVNTAQSVSDNATANQTNATGASDEVTSAAASTESGSQNEAGTSSGTSVASVDSTSGSATGSSGGQASDLEVEYAANSSYYGGGVNAQLKELLSSIDGGAVITLSAGISHEAVRNASSQADSIAYNRWLSERRIDRIADYLKANAGDRVLDIVRDFRDNDESRSVSITVN